MEKIEAKYVDNNNIELAKCSDIERLYNCLEANENFILEWYDNNDKQQSLKSELIIATNLSGKMKTGDIKITAQEAVEEKK